MNNIQKTNEVLDINAQIQIQRKILAEVEGSAYILKHKKKLAEIELNLIALENVREDLTQRVSELYSLYNKSAPTTSEEQEQIADDIGIEERKLKALVKKLDVKRLEKAITLKTLEMFK